MKKITALLLAVIMVFALVACGQPESGSDDPAKQDVIELELFSTKSENVQTLQSLVDTILQ